MAMSWPLILYEHDQTRNDIEGGDQHDEGQDQEHHIAFDLQRVEERRVALTPVDDEDWTLRRILYRAPIAVDPILDCPYRPRSRSRRQLD
jgi:hypothetical protein